MCVCVCVCACVCVSHFLFIFLSVFFLLFEFHLQMVMISLSIRPLVALNCLTSSLFSARAAAMRWRQFSSSPNPYHRPINGNAHFDLIMQHFLAARKRVSLLSTEQNPDTTSDDEQPRYPKFRRMDSIS